MFELLGVETGKFPSSPYQNMCGDEYGSIAWGRGGVELETASGPMEGAHRDIKEVVPSGEK